MALLTVSGGNRAYNIILILLLLGGGVLLWFLFSGEEATRMEQEKITKRIRVVAPEEVKPATEAPAKVASKPVPAPKRADKVSRPKEAEKKVAKEGKPVATQKPVAKKKERISTLSHPVPDGRWAVHLASFRTKKEAEGLVSRLLKAGYNAYITEFLKDGIEWHRVRVGFYGSKEEAKKVAKMLSERYEKPGAWVVKPSKKEIVEHIK